eukprot:jgi/Mesvir1/3083/Mv21141-RA.1
MTVVDRELPLQSLKRLGMQGKPKEGPMVDPVRCRVNTAQPPLSFHAAAARASAAAEQSHDCLEVELASSEDEKPGRAVVEYGSDEGSPAVIPGAQMGEESTCETSKPATTWSCSMCAHINHVRKKTCSQCGFNVFFLPAHSASGSPHITTVRHISDSIVDSHKWRASSGFGSENSDQYMSILAAESERVMRLSARRTHGRVDKLLAAEATSLLQDRQSTRLHSSLSALGAARADSAQSPQQQPELTHVLPPVLRRYSSHDHFPAEACRPPQELSRGDGRVRRRSCDERRGLHASAHDEVRESRASWSRRMVEQETGGGGGRVKGLEQELGPGGRIRSLEHEGAASGWGGRERGPADGSAVADAAAATTVAAQKEKLDFIALIADADALSPHPCLSPLAPSHPARRRRHGSASSFSFRAESGSASSSCFRNEAASTTSGGGDARTLFCSGGVDVLRGRPVARGGVTTSPTRCMGAVVASCVSDSISCCLSGHVRDAGSDGCDGDVERDHHHHHHDQQQPQHLQGASQQQQHLMGGNRSPSPASMGSVATSGGAGGGRPSSSSAPTSACPMSASSFPAPNESAPSLMPRHTGACAWNESAPPSSFSAGSLMTRQQRVAIEAALEQHLLLGPSAVSLLESGREATRSATDLALCGRTSLDTEARRECLSSLPRPEDNPPPPPLSKLRLKLLRRWSLHADPPKVVHESPFAGWGKQGGQEKTYEELMAEAAAAQGQKAKRRGGGRRGAGQETEGADEPAQPQKGGGQGRDATAEKRIRDVRPDVRMRFMDGAKLKGRGGWTSTWVDEVCINWQHKYPKKEDFLLFGTLLGKEREKLRDVIDQRSVSKDNAIAIEVLQNTAGLTAQAVKDIAAKPAPAGLAGDAPPITTWADMLKQHTTSTTSAVAAQLQRQTLDLGEEAELAKRSLNVIVKNFTRGGRRRKRLEKTLFTLDDDVTLTQQQRRRELWPTYLQLRQTKAGQPVYWKGAAIYVGHKPWQATPPPPRPQRLQTPQLN